MNSYNNAIPFHLISKSSVLAALSEAVQGSDEMFSGFLWKLAESIKSGALEYNILMNVEECVEGLKDTVALLAVIQADRH